MGRREDFEAEYWDGEIAELAFWKGVELSGAQITDLASGKSADFHPTGLAMYFKLLGDG